MRALIVDDNFDDLSSMKSILESGGFKVTAVTNGARAIDVISNDAYDVILVDIKMPTLSGYDLFSLMKERVDKKTKLIFVSIIPKKQVDMNGADGFIQKPFTPAIFIKEVKKLVK